MIDIVKKRTDRFSFLERVYEATNGHTLKYVLTSDIAQDLSWDKDKLDSVMQYLFEEELIDWMGFRRSVSITHLGIKEVESAKPSPNEPTQYFPPINVMHIEGDLINSQVQQSTSKSSQVLTVENLDKEAILTTLSEIKEMIASFQLDEDIENDLTVEIETVEAQSRRSEPRRSAVKGSLESIRSIMKGTVEKAGATALASQIPHLISQLNEYIQNLGG